MVGEGDLAGTRIVLHGSAQHMLGRHGEPEEGSAVSAEAHAASDTVVLSRFSQAGRALAKHMRRAPTEILDEEYDAPTYEAADHGAFRAGLYDLVAWHDRRADHSTAAWMAGYARVTAILPGDPDHAALVVATPLYVERVNAP
jgi:hypothetical protein